MENFKKVQHVTAVNTFKTSPPVKQVIVPTYEDLNVDTLKKSNFFSEFKTEAEKNEAKKNLGIEDPQVVEASNAYTIKNLDSISEENLYELLDESYGKYALRGQIGTKTYDISVTKISSGYVMSFHDELEVDTIKITKDLSGNVSATWTYVTYN